MNIIQQFSNIILNKTRDGFHDSTLVELKIKPENKTITINIEHWKDGKKDDEEEIYSGKFVFNNVHNIQLNNQVNCFGVEDEITSFNIRENNNFILTGSKGWILSFSSTSFKYSEKFKGIYTDK